MFTDIAVRLRSLFRRTTVEMELDDELRFHFEQQVEKYVKSGLSHEKALRRARLEFGTLDNVKEECRDARGVSLIETLVYKTHTTGCACCARIPDSQRSPYLLSRSASVPTPRFFPSSTPYYFSHSHFPRRAG